MNFFESSIFNNLFVAPFYNFSIFKRRIQQLNHF